jgi:hypothetical protein
MEAEERLEPEAGLAGEFSPESKSTFFIWLGPPTISNNDTQQNATQHNDTQHKGLVCDTQHNDTQHKGLVCDTQDK